MAHTAERNIILPGGNAMRCFSKRLLITLGLWLVTFSGAFTDHDVEIGVLSTENDAAAMQAQWSATADYLNRLIPEHHFAIVTLNEDQLYAAMEEQKLDFALTDPGHFIDLESLFDASAVVTRVVRHQDGAYADFGATILVRADRTDINTLSDLKQKSFMSTSEPFSTYHLVRHELRAQGIVPSRHFFQVIREREPEQIVFAVRDGQVDAGAVPTGTLEQMVSEGRIQRSMFRVLNEQHSFHFPLVHSTELYPEWPLAAAEHTPEHLVRRVASALLKMSDNDPAARVGGYVGWTVARSYRPMETLYQELQLGRYEHQRRTNFSAFANDNQLTVLIGLVALAAMLAGTVYVSWLNRKLAQEINWRRQTQEEMQMFSSAVQQTADAVMILDQNGRVEYVNPAFSRITGYAATDMREQTPAMLRCDGHDLNLYQRLWETVQRGESFRDEVVSRRKDGAQFHAEIAVAPLTDASGHITHFVATGRDITEKKRAEEELQLHKEQLAHTARVSIIGEMVSSLAHEISQPLTAIVNYANGCVRRVRTAEVAQPALLESLQQIVAQAQRTADVLLHLRRFLARRDATRVTTNINELVTQAAALAIGETRTRGIAIAFDLSRELPPACVDSIQIEQVILNLLRNGAEALADADGPARELKLRTALDHEGAIEVSVSDTGPGLPPRLRAKLFEPFFTTKPDGIGLGLAVSRSIIETHGGRLWVTANPDRGVTFRFTVPTEMPAHG
ncbi:MAG: PhnD/SsuA/transferrin family substrate-binding protein [Gammaproteobacteria bacterium]|nr:PhnD/SsuA/transferrin family substrate-binding protein [Gammaproteobacteria bacterium]